MIHGVPIEAGIINTTKSCTRLAQQIQRTTNVILAQLPRWLTRPEVLNETGQGTMVVSLPTNMINIGSVSIPMFNRMFR